MTVYYRIYTISVWPESWSTPSKSDTLKKRSVPWIYLVICHVTYRVLTSLVACSLVSFHKTLSSRLGAHSFKGQYMITDGKGAHACVAHLQAPRSTQRSLYSPRQCHLHFHAAATYCRRIKHHPLTQCTSKARAAHVVPSVAGTVLDLRHDISYA